MSKDDACPFGSVGQGTTESMAGYDAIWLPTTQSLESAVAASPDDMGKVCLEGCEITRRKVLGSTNSAFPNDIAGIDNLHVEVQTGKT